jgi:hypothetical protein
MYTFYRGVVNVLSYISKVYNIAGSKMKCNTVVMLSVEALYGQRIQAVSG